MKYFLTLVLSVLLFTTNAQNLIMNPGFEEGTDPWTFVSSGSIVEGNSHSGSKALRLTSNGGAKFKFENLQPHTTYEFGAWMKSDNGQPVMLRVKYSGDNMKKVRVTATEYTYVSLKYTTGPSHEKSFIHIFGDGGTGYVDDVSFTYHSDFEDNYSLIWSDEFDVDGAPDPNNWKYENGFVRNNELQWYQKDNAFCEDGVLVIEGRREKRENPNYEAGSDNWKKSRQYINYTSSSIKSNGKFTFQFGRMEVRAKVTNDKGTWPAIWTLGKSCEWPSNGEVDIMENYGGKLLANFAWGTNTRWSAKWDGGSRKVNDLGANWTDDFHIWQLVWEEDHMTIYVDDVLLNDVDLSTTINGSAKCEGQNPFQQPHYILLNLALGSNGGDPSNTAFPNRYLVDYVRVYQKKVDCNGEFAGGAYIDSCGTCLPADSIDNSCDPETSALEEDIENGFKVYPNPCEGLLSVQVNAGLYQEMLTVHDISGAIITQMQVTNDLMHIDLKDFTAGVYFVSIGDDIKKVVKV